MVFMQLSSARDAEDPFIGRRTPELDITCIHCGKKGPFQSQYLSRYNAGTISLLSTQNLSGTSELRKDLFIDTLTTDSQ